MAAPSARPADPRIDNVVTSGQFHLDGGCWDVDNNVWIVGDDTECLIVDPAHQAEPILAAVGDRRVVAIVCTHGHDDHITAAGPVRRVTGAPVLLHPADRMLWDTVYPDDAPDGELADGEEIVVAGITLRVLHTPGHSPGAVSLLLIDRAGGTPVVFTGDTLFAGGPGATGRSFSDFGTIIRSIRSRLLVLDPATTVRTGHGPQTTIGAEAPRLQEWITRGY